MTAIATPPGTITSAESQPEVTDGPMLRSQTRFAAGASAARIATALRSMADHLDTLDDVEIHDLVVCPAASVGAHTTVTAYDQVAVRARR